MLRPHGMLRPLTVAPFKHVVKHVPGLGLGQDIAPDDLGSISCNRVRGSGMSPSVRCWKKTCPASLKPIRTKPAIPSWQSPSRADKGCVDGFLCGSRQPSMMRISAPPPFIRTRLIRAAKPSINWLRLRLGPNGDRQPDTKRRARRRSPCCSPHHQKVEVFKSSEQERIVPVGDSLAAYRD